tara:strand:+ start:317 stop:607 length:291 start_codon:yes stop_codon:yes gene_type:complete
MPSKSKAQHKFMAAVANNPKFAKETGVPQSVGKEYMKADEGKKFKKGGETFPDLNKDGKVTQADVLKGRGVKGFNRGGNVHKCPRDGIAQRGKTRA